MPTWSAEQISNARLGIAACKAEGLGTNAQVITVMTMITEATLVNVGYGDHPVSMGGAMSSSRGLFQQIKAWGPEADREDPAKATYMFLHGGAQGQRGLLDVNGWQNMQPWEAAQAVQGSEFSDGSNYRANYQYAVDLVNQYGSDTSGGGHPANAGPPAKPSSTAGKVSPFPLGAGQHYGPGGSVTGSGVNRIQQRLKDRGYAIGTVDGQYGPQTVAAVKACVAKAPASLHLNRDGWVAAATWAYIRP